MADRTIQISERDRWSIVIVAQLTPPKSFAETRLLNHLWDTFKVDAWDGTKRVPDLATTPEPVQCDEAVLRFLLANFEPMLARLGPPFPIPPKDLANEFMALHERLSQ